MLMPNLFRCSRNCFECPRCESPVNITAVPTISRVTPDYLRPPDPQRSREKGDEAGQQEYSLQCGYCHWSTLDVGVRLPKSVKIGDQLSKIRKARTNTTRPTRSLQTATAENGDEELQEMDGVAFALGHDKAFANLTTFYRTEMREALGESGNPYASANSPYSSPANLARIMSLYNGSSSFQALKKTRQKPQPFAEARSQNEGISAYHSHSTDEDQPTYDDQDIISNLSLSGLDHTTNAQQRLSAPQTNFDARFLSDLWPAATKLRTKRGKRCRTCRQYLARPDAKLNNLRYKIRLVASNHLPLLTTKPLNPTVPPIPGSAAFRLREEDLSVSTQTTVIPGRALQYILTIRNPIFEPVKISLATPQITPGKVGSRVTILCPSFTVGPAGDVWEEALGSASTTAASSSTDGGRRAALASLNGSSIESATNAGEKVPEAGKIWDKSRNTTSVILEVVPGDLSPLAATDPDENDDDVLEIPIFVHVEWTAHHHHPTGDEGVKRSERDRPGTGAATGSTVGREIAADGSERKELGVWCVLGLGRIMRSNE